MERQLIVLKIGTSTLMQQDNQHISLSNLGRFVELACNLKRKGHKVVIVTSGAVGVGCMHLKCSRPTTAIEKQAIAAVGQAQLLPVYDRLFALSGENIAQLLMTRSDFSVMSKYLNLKGTLLELLKLDVIPIVNENDSVTAEDQKFGDNDSLAAQCAILISANWLFLLTDVDCLYTANPRVDPNAKPIPFVERIDELEKVVTQKHSMGSVWGSGGMQTKLTAAEVAAAAGVNTGLVNGTNPERVLALIEFGERNAAAKNSPKSEEAEGDRVYPARPLKMGLFSPGTSDSPRAGYHRADSVVGGVVALSSMEQMPYIGTIFRALEVTQSIRDQRRWILSLPVSGRVFIDEGAVRAVTENKKSLLAAGVVRVEGTFTVGTAVSLAKATGESAGKEVARCIINFSSSDLDKIKGLKSASFVDVLGSDTDPEVSYRCNVIRTS